MEYTKLGKTGLKVSVAGLGCGGFSRVGQGTGRSAAESIALIRQALDLGVNFIDTAQAYQTEELIGRALQGRRRHEVVISTKAQVQQEGKLCSAEQVVEALENSLRQLKVDWVDVFHLHGVPPTLYAQAVETLVPALTKEREKGKFRFLGVTEVPPEDPTQEMLQRAVREGCFEVVMLAFHMLHQRAREKLFVQTQAQGIGVLNMFAVRLLFSEAGRLQRVVDGLAAAGKVPAELAAEENPLGFLMHPEGARNVIDAAYRYCRHEPGVDVVLFGTGDETHLRANVESILRGPLPEADVARLRMLFGALEGVGLDRPGQTNP